MQRLIVMNRGMVATFLESKHLKQLTLMSVIIENMIQWNTIVQQLGWFCICNWSKHKPIVYAEEKCLTILYKSTHVISEYPSGYGLEFLRGAEQPSRYSKTYLVWLPLLEGEQSTSWHLSSSPASSVHCMVGRDFVTPAVSLVTKVMTVKTLLQRSLPNY